MSTVHARPDAADELPARPRLRTAAIVALATVLALLVGGAAGALWRGDDRRAVLDVRGTATLDVVAPGSSTNDGDLYELRDSGLEGPVTAELPGRRLAGVLTVSLNSAFLRTGTGPSIAHSWGAASAVLDGASCKGSYAFSHYHDPREVGGSLNLRCSDGSVLGAAFYLDRSEYVQEVWRAHMHLRDGFYLPPE